MNKTEILFICRKQFGYSVDNYYHCFYLREDYEITYLSPDVGWDKVNLEGIKTLYVNFHKNRILNNLRYYLFAIYYISKIRFKLIILNRSYFFFLFQLFHPFKTFIYDIRSGNVNPNRIKRFLLTLSIKIDLLFYKNITVISDSLAQSLKIPKYQLLPLGAMSFNLPEKKFNEIQVVYVGSLNHRRIEETIDGFSQFVSHSNCTKKLSYHIYGFGNPEIEKSIVNRIKRLALEHMVFFHGRIFPTELEETLSKHNVGISYVPKTPWFDVQPPTKTFEYLLAGIPVIATKTMENARIINERNGILITDSADGVRRGLEIIIANIDQGLYSSSAIVKHSQTYSWEYIVKSILKPYVELLINNK